MKLVIGNRTYSSWSLRGWLAVKASGTPFEEIFLPLRTDEFRARIRDYSPTGLVPCLIDGESVVPDSLAIIDYLDRAVPGATFWPDDLAAYGEARAIVAEMHSGFRPLRMNCPMTLRASIHDFEPDEDTRVDIDTIVARWTHARANHGQGGPFLFGTWSAADIMYAPVVTRFDTYGLSDDPVALAYIEAVLAHPHMVEWIEAAKLEPPAAELYNDLPVGTLREGFRV
jgi:glutathione S-transferase